MTPAQEQIQERIERQLRRHVDPGVVGPVCEAVLRGRVVQLDPEKSSGVVASRHGVLFVGGREYVIGTE